MRRREERPTWSLLRVPRRDEGGEATGDRKRGVAGSEAG